MECLPTKEHLRFIEFAEACRQYRYIGLCYGPAGVGKTLSAWEYSGWRFLKENYDQVKPMDSIIRSEVVKCTSVFYTAGITNTPKSLWLDLFNKMQIMGKALLQAQGEIDVAQIALNAAENCPLVIVDEADRLKINTMEQLRDIYDTYDFGLILIGMPGIEKRLMRYAQLYSRIGFAHEFRPLGKQDLLMVVKHLCKNLSIKFDKDDPKYLEAITVINRITHGNFRLTERLLSQIQRIQKVNRIKYLDKEIVEAARNLLVIGKV